MSVTTNSTGAQGQSDDPHPLIQKVRHSTVPIGELIGFRVNEITTGRAVASLRSGPQHANPMGTLHGGVLCDLADAAMGMASFRRWRPMSRLPRPP
jgi:acyl-coenzyme A thioesterase PaaI-like protein